MSETLRSGLSVPLIVTSATPAQSHSSGFVEGVSMDESGEFSVICSDATFAVNVTNKTGLPVIASGTGTDEVPRSGPGRLNVWITSSENVIPLQPLQKFAGRPTSAVRWESVDGIVFEEPFSGSVNGNVFVKSGWTSIVLVRRARAKTLLSAWTTA